MRGAHDQPDESGPLASATAIVNTVNLATTRGQPSSDLTQGTLLTHLLFFFMPFKILRGTKAAATARWAVMVRVEDKGRSVTKL